METGRSRERVNRYANFRRTKWMLFPALLILLIGEGKSFAGGQITSVPILNEMPDLNGEMTHDDPTVVNCSAGLIRGKFIHLSNGEKVLGYLGIPYAEPPVAQLRFKPPVPRFPFLNVFNATEFGNLCVQSKSRSHWDIVTTRGNRKVLRRLGLWDYPQGEDCLNLNIYVPWKANSTSKRKDEGLSVMFYIHGGSYKTNGGRFYPGEWLAHVGNVIVVTMNYRLGVFGFLSTQDSAAEGNYGLLDQVLALKWLKQNVKAFGGNETDVTIFGNSAGGACAGLHLMSPMSKGLFSKIIAQSGSPIGEWAVQRKPRVYAKQLAKKLQCPNVTNTYEMIECLQAISAESIVDKSEDATLEDSLMLQFAPSVDKKFLPKMPVDLLQQGYDISNVPVMAGVTRDELEVWMTKSYQDKDPSAIPFTKDLLRRYLPNLVRRDLLSPVVTDILLHTVYTEYVYRHDDISKHHAKKRKLQSMKNVTSKFHEKSSTLADIRTLGKIISDIDLKAPTLKLVNLLSPRPNISVYMYEFDYASPDDVILNKHSGDNGTWVGSYHESELYYIFGFPHLNLENALRLPEDREVSNIMMQLWANFAKYGNPTPENLEDSTYGKNFTWPRYKEDEENFASLGLQPFVSRSYEPERMIFWNHFVPILLQYDMSVHSPNIWTTKFEINPRGALTPRCNFEVLIAIAFIGWATCILCSALLIHLCLCRRIRLFSMRNLPIPV